MERVDTTSGKSSYGYEQIRELLNDIQGSCVPAYQGLNAFWQDYETLLTAELYGQRLVAPANGKNEPQNGNSGSEQGCCSPASVSGHKGSSCWPSGGSRNGGSVSTDTSRSECSALITGMQGLAPFDHSIYPPLLWSAQRSPSAAEIQVIANWIDDGCPKDAPRHSEAEQSRRNSSNRFALLAAGDARHSVDPGCTNALRKDHKGLKVRKEIGSLTDVEVQRLRDGIACMKSFDAHWQDERSFAFWARMHANSCQHGWEQFLPWHRLYLYFFEQMLQDFDEHITLPYWAWSDYADENRATVNNTHPDLGRLPERYGCWITREAVATLSESGLFNEQEIEQLRQLASDGTVFQSSARFLKGAKIEFATRSEPALRWSSKIQLLFTELQRINPLWIPQRWPGSMGPRDMSHSPASYPTADDIERLLQIPVFADFGGGPEADHHFGHLEQIHNGMHNFAGGINPNFPAAGQVDLQNIDNPPYGWMVDNRVTAFDPLFWAHHANVDRIWQQWQVRHPHGNPDQLDAVLAPWSLTVKDGLSTSKLGYEYLRNSYHYPVSRDHAMVKFHSEKAGVDAGTLDSFRKADIRLHRVQSADLPNARIRVYVNDDNSDENTSSHENDNFVGELQTFHGSCYGGPGHCELPLDRTRPFDLRGLHHKEPKNYRVEATDAINRMLARGATDISVHLVVTGLDGRLINNALYFEGVSLNFMD